MKKYFLTLIFSMMLILSVSCTKSNVTNNIELDDSNSISKNDISNDISSNEIFGSFSIEASFSYEPTPENLIGESSSVAKIKVLSIEEPIFIDELDPNMPFTPVNVEVIDTLSGEKLENEIKIYTSGGEVLVNDLINQKPEGFSEKIGLDNLSEKEKNSLYISYNSEYFYDFNIGDEYVTILGKHPNGMYITFSDGYGIFNSVSTPKNKSLSSSGEVYRNVITQEDFDFKSTSID